MFTSSGEGAQKTCLRKATRNRIYPVVAGGLYFVPSESTRNKSSRGYDLSGDRQVGMATFRCVGQLSSLSSFILVALHVFGSIGHGSGSGNQPSSLGTYNTALVARKTTVS